MTVTTTRSDGGSRLPARPRHRPHAARAGCHGLACGCDFQDRDRGPRDRRQPDRHRDVADDRDRPRRRTGPRATRTETPHRGAAAPARRCSPDPGRSLQARAGSSRWRSRCRRSGPATFEATVAGLTDGRLEVKLDVPGFDPDVTADVVVLQPTALLRAGVVDVGAVRALPLRRRGRRRLPAARSPWTRCRSAWVRRSADSWPIAAGREKLQEVRLELRTRGRGDGCVSGKDEEITFWTGRMAGEGEFGGRRRAAAFDGELADPLAADDPPPPQPRRRDGST